MRRIAAKFIPRLLTADQDLLMCATNFESWPTSRAAEPEPPPFQTAPAPTPDNLHKTYYDFIT
jgi:hypothetical protein